MGLSAQPSHRLIRDEKNLTVTSKFLTGIQKSANIATTTGKLFPLFNSLTLLDPILPFLNVGVDIVSVLSASLTLRAQHDMRGPLGMARIKLGVTSAQLVGDLLLSGTILRRAYDRQRPFHMYDDEIEPINRSLTWELQRTAEQVRKDISDEMTRNMLSVDQLRVQYPILHKFLQSSSSLTQNNTFFLSMRDDQIKRFIREQDIAVDELFRLQQAPLPVEDELPERTHSLDDPMKPLLSNARRADARRSLSNESFFRRHTDESITGNIRHQVTLKTQTVPVQELGGDYFPLSRGVPESKENEVSTIPSRSPGFSQLGFQSPSPQRAEISVDDYDLRARAATPGTPLYDSMQKAPIEDVQKYVKRKQGFRYLESLDKHRPLNAGFGITSGIAAIILSALS